MFGRVANWAKKEVGFSKLLMVVLVVTVGIIIFWPSLSLALFGDDWLTIYRYKLHAGGWSDGTITKFSFFFNPYGPQDLITGLIYEIFGFWSTPYYVLSFLFRTLAAFTVFFVINKLTDNSLASFFSAVFFIVTPIGLETTNWVFNMTSYLGIMFLGLFFYFFLKSQDKFTTKGIFFSALFYYLAFIFAPIRMHGMPFWALALDIIFLMRGKIKLKEAIFRQGAFFATFAFIRLTGNSMGQAADTFYKLSTGIDYIFSSLAMNKLSFILHPFVIIGRFIFPESMWDIVNSIYPNPAFKHLLTGALVVIFPILIVIRHILPKSFWKFQLILIVGWTILVWFIMAGDIGPVSFIPTALIGGYFFSSLSLLLFTKKDHTLLIASLVWIFMSFAFPYLWGPSQTFGTIHRYMIMPAFGISLFWGSLLHETKPRGIKIVAILYILLVTASHAVITNSFLSSQVSVHGDNITNKVYSSFPSIEDYGRTTPLVMYFEGDSAIIYHTLSFGLQPHFGLLYDNPEHIYLPVPVDSYNNLLDTVVTGNYMTAHGHPKIPVPLENIYSFLITSDGTVDISNKIRLQLLKDLE